MEKKTVAFHLQDLGIQRSRAQEVKEVAFWIQTLAVLGKLKTKVKKDGLFSETEVLFTVLD